MGRGEIACRESAIDDRDEVSAGVFIRIPEAPLKERDAERSEISLVDQHHTGLRLLAIASSVDTDSTLIASIRRRGIRADSDSGDTWDGCDLLANLLDVSGAPFARLNAVPLASVLDVQHDADLHDICGIVAQRHLHEFEKAADGSARCGHEKKRERDLGGDENAPAMLCRSSDNANLPAWEHMRGIVTRETECGDKTKEDAAEQRERNGEREDGSLDADDGFGWQGIRRKQQRKLCQAVRRSNAKDGARRGDDDGFDQQLADDAPTTGADRAADGELMLARATTGQQQDGAVGAGDDEQEHNACEKKRQGAAGILLERHDDRLQGEMPVIGKAIRMLLRKLAHDGLKRSVGGGKCDVGPELD